MARNARTEAPRATQEAPEAPQTPQAPSLTPAKRRALLEAAAAKLRESTERVQVVRPATPAAPSLYVDQVAAAYEHGAWVQVEAGSELEGKVILRELRKALRQINEANGTDIRFTEASGFADGVFVVQVKPRDKQEGRGRPVGSRNS